MIEILGLELNKVVYFDHARTSMTQSGLTFVRGLNLDSDPATPSSNGAGKTLLFSTIPNLFYFATPLSIKKKSKKDILGKGSSISITFRTSGSEYKVVQEPSRYTIIKDGEDLEVKKIPVAESLIRELFPLSEVLFYSTCYVSTQRPFPFQQDSDSARLEHLVDMFRLDQYDLIRDHFATKLRQIKDNEVKLSVLTQRKGVLDTRLGRALKDIEDQDIEGLKTRANGYEKKSRALEQERYRLDTLLKALSELHQVESQLDDLRPNYPYKKSPSLMLPELKEQRTAARNYESYLRAREQYEASSSHTIQELESIVLPGTEAEDLGRERQQLRDLVVDLQKRILEQKETRTRYRKLTEERQELLTELADLGFDLEQAQELEEDFESQLSVCRATLKLESLLEHQEGHDLTCPTCMTDLDVQDTRKAVRAAKSISKVLKQKLRAQSLCRSISSIQPGEYDPSILMDLKSKYLTLIGRQEKVEEWIETYKRHAYLTRTLESMKAPTRCTPSTKTVAQLDRDIDLCSSIAHLLGQKSTLIKAHPELDLRGAQAAQDLLTQTTTALKTTESSLLAFKKKLAQVSSEITGLSSALQSIDLYKQELAETLTSIALVQNGAGQRQLIEVLLKAYGARGLRTIMANEICSLIETNLNHYRGLVFAEPFVFTVKASELGLQILVDRANDIVSDVRTLSGAESNAFRMLFVLSVLPLLPDDRRTNFLVLDEPTSHCDDVSRQIFLERFLPAIQSIVPHTFVISPHESDSAPESTEWVVRKHNGVSELLN